MNDAVSAWNRAETTLKLLCVDPGGLGGLWLRARAGPVRDVFTAALPALPLPLRRIHPGIADEQLFGGVDLSATLSAGKLVLTKGLLGTRSALILTMAERATPGLAARLGRALDGPAPPCLIALDEGAEPDETLPSGLTDRLAFHVELDGIGFQQAQGPEIDPDQAEQARNRLDSVETTSESLTDLAALALHLGIDSLRAPLLALRAARAHAAWAGRRAVGPDDLTTAVALVYAARATRMPDTAPEEEDSPPPPPEPADDPSDSPPGDSDTLHLPEEILLEAVKAALPPDLLARLASGKLKTGSKGASGTGTKRKGNRRGRPLPSRPGRLDGTARIDLVATLRAAAPWQPMRRALAGAAQGQGLLIRPPDLRLRRYEEKSDRLLIFTVDASGSAALSRLAEAKGAIELLLAEAYARRDHVALVSFRGVSAEILLPPTRSLVQTKRRLAGLPGGGGTPLASGLKAAMELAHQSRGRGMTPTIALLTDGRANIALDGSADRTRAAEDSETLARAARASDTPALVIDMSNRPQKALKGLADTLLAPYLPLPRADAYRLSTAVSAALEA